MDGLIAAEDERAASAPAALSASAGAGAARRRKAVVLTALTAAVVAVLAFSLTLGRYDMDFGQLLALLAAPFTGGDALQTADANVFFTIRLPRVLAALIVGAALSGAGCAFQGIFKNPMVRIINDRRYKIRFLEQLFFPAGRNKPHPDRGFHPEARGGFL